jgi:cytochrome b
LPASGQAHGANEWLEEVHGAPAYGTLLLIALHILGVVYASLTEGENLVHNRPKARV